MRKKKLSDEIEEWIQLKWVTDSRFLRRVGMELEVQISANFSTIYRINFFKKSNKWAKMIFPKSATASQIFLLTAVMGWIEQHYHKLPYKNENRQSIGQEVILI